ncbi:MAG: hypothetical protein E6Q97_07495 [Desulfurellales bacterium]|nr:MAG: hypothetical protein E6Q97_07495 [Desulfurellales bacterium]
MTDKTSIQLPPESKGLLERLIQERDAAVQRLDVALVATKAALGVPVEWGIRNLDEGFTEVTNGVNN